MVKERGVPSGVNVILSLAFAAFLDVLCTLRCLACETADSLREEESKNISLPSILA